MAVTVEAVRLRMNAVAEATLAERRHRMVDLMTAGVEMTALVTRYHDWLVKEDVWLTANGGHDEWTRRDQRYIDRLFVYQDACNVLIAALEMIGADGQVAREPVREQLAL